MTTTNSYLRRSYTGGKKRCLNLASYNYLGFASGTGAITDEVVDIVKKYGVGCCSSRSDVGNTSLHELAEKMTAEYVGKEAAMIFGMGYGTNSTTIPALAGKVRSNSPNILNGLASNIYYLERFNYFRFIESCFIGCWLPYCWSQS